MNAIWRRAFQAKLYINAAGKLLAPPTAVKKFPPGCHLHQAASQSILASINKLEAGNELEIEWENGERSRFHSSWLRFNCQCNTCRQANSGQKTITSTALPDHIAVSSLSIAGSGGTQEMIIKWKNEEHSSKFSLNWLLENSYSDADLERQSQQRAIEPYKGKTPPTVQYGEMMTTDKGLLKYLTQINEHGCSLVTGVPCGEDDDMKVAERIGPILNTIYGKNFQVVSLPQPINIAYSDVHLPLHMDLSYYQSPPGLQLLLCTKYSDCVVGGDSMLLDVFAVAEEFRQTNPEDFNTLVRVPATFQKIHFEREHPVYMKYQRPHIVLNHRKEIVAVTWSPTFEGPLFVNQDDVEPYYKAYRRFDKAIEMSPLKLEFKLHEGELIIFNNIRMLHGRQAFQLNGGTRKLQGCYVNIDEFRNKVDVMSRLVGDGRLSRRVGNNCFF